MSAFAGDPHRQRQWRNRLRAAIAADRIGQHPLHADGERTSVVACLIDGTDLQAWDAQGLPRWLALAIDGVLAELPSRADAAAAGVYLVDALVAGADYAADGSRLLLQLLEDALDAARHADAGAETDALQLELQRLIALHRQCGDGQAVAPASWRALRRRATALTDCLAPGLPRLAGACLEVAAWDPRQSRAAVLDTLRAWVALRCEQALRHWGWSAQDEAEVQRRLAEVHARALAAGADPARIDAFALLSRAYPALEARLRQKLAQECLQWPQAWAQALARLLLQLQLQASAPVGAAQRPGPTPPLIPREDLFAEPERSQLRISPDGRWLAWLSAGAGVSNLWAAPLQDPTQARQLTFDGRRGISSYRWSWRPGLLLFAQDRDGDENWRLYAVAADGGAARPLTPAGGVRASLAAVSRLHPDTVLVSLNARDPRWPDLYRLELESATLTLHEANPGIARFVIDDDYRVRLAVRNEADGGATVLRRHEGDWRPWLSYPAEDARTSGPSHYGGDGERLYLYDSRGRDTAALYEVAGEAGTLRLMAADPLADLGGLLTDAAEHRPGAVALTRLRPSWLALQPSLQEELDWLEQRLPGQWTLDSRSGDDRLWLLQSGDDDDPGASWLYRRDRRRLERLQLHRPRLAGQPLARMRPQLIGARDGLALVAYLSLPIEAEIAPAWAARPLPLVLLVHGGPWSRDGFGYNALHQWLANRGYAVLSVNFRGSIGFGKAFLDAGNGEWGRRMDEDLEDAVQWAIDRGIADPARLAIFGASYGGYAVLSALTRYPDRYACGIDVVGPSNLETLLAAIPPYWEAARAMQYRAIGNPETEHGRALLRERSPLHRAGRIRAPLLIAQGGNDPRVKQAESERMVAALRGNGIAVEYALYPDEGHGFVRESNRMSFNALAEAFLARHLGGRAEPAPAGGFPGSSLRLC